jgi:hypothetical protein
MHESEFGRRGGYNMRFPYAIFCVFLLKFCIRFPYEIVCSLLHSFLRDLLKRFYAFVPL